jgi:hypothetical protein
MHAGMVEVQNLDWPITEIDNVVPDPLSPIAQNDDFPSLM